MYNLPNKDINSFFVCFFVFFQSEISNTCKENVRTLNSMLDSVENRTGLLSVQECRDIRGK